MSLPNQFEPGTIFGIYDGVVPLSRNDESLVVVAWDVPGGRAFDGEFYDIECELVSEPEFRAFALAVCIFQRCLAAWTNNAPPKLRSNADLYREKVMGSKSDIVTRSYE